MPTLRELVEYHRPTDLEEAIKLLKRPDIRTVPLAGGTALVPSAARDVEAVVDLGGLGLSYVKPCEGSEVPARLCIGATTTLQMIVEDGHVLAYAESILVKATLDTASRNIRDAATIAGSIVAGEGNSPLLTMLLALDARLIVRGDREEEVSLAQWTPQERSLILRVILPPVSKDARVAYEKVARTPADMPIVCVAARATQNGDALRDVRLAIGGVAHRPQLIVLNEATIENAAQLAVEVVQPTSDYFASAEYRREMIGVLVKRCLQGRE